MAWLSGSFFIPDSSFSGVGQEKEKKKATFL